ncbi:hypothetical protein EC991_003362 [Linnemannia zychae]|nr:hypothetical protein EC991_003362 [Linnemannia zychae]
MFVAGSIASSPEPCKNLASTRLNKWPSAIYSTTPSDKIISLETELRRRAWPAIRCIKRCNQFTSSSTSDRAKAPSDNVPLFLSQQENNEGNELQRFEPTILMKRFKKWKEAQDELQLPAGHDTDLELLDIETDLQRLEEEGDFLSRNNLSVEDYKGLCNKHCLQRVFRATSGEGTVDNIMDQFLCMEHEGVPTTPASRNDQVTLPGDAVPGDLLQASQDPIMQLPRIVGWSAFNSDVIQTTSKDTAQAMPDPDFVLEQDMTSSTEKHMRGTLKQIWLHLDSVQQHHLLQLLARMLIGIWDNFDILDDGQHDASPTDQKWDVSPDNQEEIHRQTRPDGAESWFEQVGADQNTTANLSQRQTAEDRLRQLEEEFMNRSFLDAVREATKFVQPRTTQQCDQNIDDCGNLSFRNTSTVRDKVAIDTISRNTSATGAHSPWNLDDHDTIQRMTTTRARAKESSMAQDRAFILPLHPTDTQECGSARPFDFSLDDLLIQATVRQESGSLSQLQDPTIVGVSRWKSVGLRPPSAPLLQFSKELLPRSSNVFQTAAQGSPYPLIHLFSLPDVFCPVQFGGIEEGGEESVQHGLSHVLVRTLAKHQPLVAELLTEEVEVKEQRIYHRWMAAWHERSPKAPKATRVRYETMKLLRQHSQNGGRLFAGVNIQGKDIPQSVSRSRLSHRPSSPPIQQPEYNEGADLDYETPSSARCPICRDEWNEQERTRQERDRFHEACELLEKMVVDETYQQGRGARGEEGRESRDDQMWTTNYAQQTQVGKQTMVLGLGLSNAQQHSLSQLLSLGLGLGLGLGDEKRDSFNRESMDASNSGEGKSTTGATTAKAEVSTVAHPWRLSEEEKTIVETHLWGSMRQRAIEQEE